MIDSAKRSLPMKKQKKYKTHKPKKRWFNKECEKARKCLKMLKLNPLDIDLTKETSEKLKEFKKICKKQQSSFWDT